MNQETRFMKRILNAALLILAAALPLAAAEGTRIVVTTHAPKLPPGTRVFVEMKAEYSMVDLSRVSAPKPGAGPQKLEITDDMIRYRLASPQTFVWDFVVPADGKVPVENFTFTFPKLLPTAPNGMAAGITFPTHYRVVVPGEKTPVVIDRHSEFGMSYDKAAAVITRCVRMGGSSATTIGMGVLADCTVDPRKMPGAKVLPQ
jgi:hypothetical protein